MQPQADRKTGPSEREEKAANTASLPPPGSPIFPPAPVPSATGLSLPATPNQTDDECQRAIKANRTEIVRLVALLDSDQFLEREEASKTLKAMPEQLPLIISTLNSNSLSAEQKARLADIICGFLPSQKRAEEFLLLHSEINLSNSESREILSETFNAVQKGDVEAVKKLFRASNEVVEYLGLIKHFDEQLQKKGIILAAATHSENTALSQLASSSKELDVQIWALKHIDDTSLRVLSASNLQELAKASPEAARRLIDNFLLLSEKESIDELRPFQERILNKIMLENPFVATRYRLEQGELTHRNLFSTLHGLEQAALLSETSDSSSRLISTLAKRYIKDSDENNVARVKDVVERHELAKTLISNRKLLERILGPKLSDKYELVFNKLANEIAHANLEEVTKKLGILKQGESRVFIADAAERTFFTGGIRVKAAQRELERQLDKILSE